MGEKLTEAQQAARLAILKAVAGNAGNPMQWGELHRRGHHFMQVRACVQRGDLNEDGSYRYSITPSGRAALENGR